MPAQGAHAAQTSSSPSLQAPTEVTALKKFEEMRAVGLDPASASCSSSTGPSNVLVEFSFKHGEAHSYLHGEQGSVVGQMWRNGLHLLRIRVDSPKVNTVPGCPAELQMYYVYRLLPGKNNSVDRIWLMAKDLTWT
jgi:hypothetical protein